VVVLTASGCQPSLENLPKLTNKLDFASNSKKRDMPMSEMIELSESELDMIAGGQTVGPVSVQTNVNASAEVAVATAVLTENSYVSANNNLILVQVSTAAFAAG
jgi:hypothetical protein